MKVKVEYYKSIVCPRCWPVSYELGKMSKEFPEMEIEYIEVFTQRDRTEKAGIGAIPTLIVNGKYFSSFMPKREDVRKFILEQMKQ